MITTQAQWQPANNGSGKMRWFLWRDVPAIMDCYYWNTDGTLKRFASADAARKFAAKENHSDN